ncbi:hypothetical protein H0H81_003956 [Sphagnurus paluster]|uniref:Uncharacterized protein n=1 Tax=Sphagnurus paluster TaxID=117069 RepID=A0A9P7KER6_9AGAR|nr:hypothetical protein H0H81_003956 [Sphagnurus paluster]
MSAEVSSLGVALVTGANRGIGRGIALRLAKDGYDVGINGRSTALESLETLQKEITALGRRACIAIGDISVSRDVENMVSTVVEELGQLNVMVANAGISGKQGTPILQIEASDWDAVLSINSLGTFLSYKYAALQMIKQGKGGRIIGATSIFGKRGDAPSQQNLPKEKADLELLSGSAYSAPYSPSKFAICGLTQVAGNWSISSCIELW